MLFEGQACSGSLFVFVFSQAVNVTFLLLFGQLFAHAYGPQAAAARRREQQQQQEQHAHAN